MKYISLFIWCPVEKKRVKNLVTNSCVHSKPININFSTYLLQYSSVCKVVEDEYKCISTATKKKKKTGTLGTPIISGGHCFLKCVKVSYIKDNYSIMSGGHCLLKCVKDRYIRDTCYQRWALLSEMC